MHYLSKVHKFRTYKQANMEKPSTSKTPIQLAKALIGINEDEDFDLRKLEIIENTVLDKLSRTKNIDSFKTAVELAFSVLNNETTTLDDSQVSLMSDSYKNMEDNVLECAKATGIFIHSKSPLTFSTRHFWHRPDDDEEDDEPQQQQQQLEPTDTRLQNQLVLHKETMNRAEKDIVSSSSKQNKSIERQQQQQHHTDDRIIDKIISHKWKNEQVTFKVTYKNYEGDNWSPLSLQEIVRKDLSALKEYMDNTCPKRSKQHFIKMYPSLIRLFRKK